LCTSRDKNSAFIIVDLADVIRKKNVILNVHFYFPCFQFSIRRNNFLYVNVLCNFMFCKQDG
jgi:hypothetical protein